MPTLAPGGLAEEGEVFPLYENRSATYEKTYERKTQYLLYFDGSVRGLAPGAPVEFRGIKIGQVTDVKLEFHTDAMDVRIPVLIEIEPDRYSWSAWRSRTWISLIEIRSSIPWCRKDCERSCKWAA